MSQDYLFKINKKNREGKTKMANDFVDKTKMFSVLFLILTGLSWLVYGVTGLLSMLGMFDSAIDLIGIIAGGNAIIGTVLYLIILIGAVFGALAIMGTDGIMRQISLALIVVGGLVYGLIPILEWLAVSQTNLLMLIGLPMGLIYVITTLVGIATVTYTTISLKFKN